MVIPAAIYIEMGRDSVKRLPEDVLTAELKEFHVGMGEDWSEEKAQGYLIGIETARRFLAGIAPGVPIGKLKF